jgi:hypothetical protein
MKNLIKYLLVVLLIIPTSVFAQKVSLHAMFGGRYDDLRMCVGSPAGVKGGPVGDIQLDIPIHQTEKQTIVLNLPIMRPVLFSLAFRMLQFEPELTFETRTEKRVWGPGAGLSIHYGPDYRYDMDSRKDDFWAAGPFFSYLYGFEYPTQRVALRAFYSPLFSQARNPGTVIGLNLEYYRHF